MHLHSTALHFTSQSLNYQALWKQNALPRITPPLWLQPTWEREELKGSLTKPARLHNFLECQISKEVHAGCWCQNCQEETRLLSDRRRGYYTCKSRLCRIWLRLWMLLMLLSRVLARGELLTVIFAVFRAWTSRDSPVWTSTAWLWTWTHRFTPSVNQ